jgi:hypothetical protein
MANFLSSDANLYFLEAHFSTREINNVVKNMPSDKSPSPANGFNAYFFRKYLPIIKQDFYLLCSSFHRMELCLSSINGSYITLIPKKENDIKVGDIQPISLLNISIKLITNLLANRLQKVITSIVH